ncbi:MAG: glycosyltransferase family 9 protein, partial [Candidatus Cloacimonetes bacterium]|nr:glycosyltransferase family 9 protein [Candidatus Cloacimonadota bacterium]
MKILIIRLSSLGDIVLTQPVAKVLREVYPKAKIDFVTKQQFVNLVKAFGCVDEILIWEKGNFSNIGNLFNLRNQYDIVIDLHSKLNTFLIKKIINAKRTVAYRKKHLLRQLIIRKLTDQEIISTVDLYFSALRKLGIERNFTNPILYPKEKTPTNLGNLVSFKNSKKIAIIPGAIHKTKQYP